ncbi:putative ram signaling pathway protein [Botrytis fragariae]|uniref:Putative ram signaling pathway protein n=1 Tax=Botrytis fragariae TaxID=1964551 RepID=A0A8H6AL99_9HELO|nr:putative ram signaling pathway protein [Botrytis fragariae]KAF5869798.1 putative ram signaling pathway protein [Botrytis fragariae]
MGPTGPPLGAAIMSSGRPKFENGMPGPGPGPRPQNLSASRRGPPLRHAQSNSSLSSKVPPSQGQVVALVRESMNKALEENIVKAAESSAVSNELMPGVTIDLSHRRIQRFPEEVVDIIKVELVRLALSHNEIQTFPSRFAECTSLRYLNLRNNIIREFPPAICQLNFLEILDLGRNKLRTLPPGIINLTSLKVLSVQRNRIEELPLCVADMTSLQVLKLDGNPLRFPPKEILQAQALNSPSGGPLQEGEIDDLAVTAHIKRFLKSRAMGRPETESGGEESSEGTETPRPTMKRVVSGRFPIKVDGVPPSPAQPRPPPIPSRSHQRGFSQQNAALRRPGVMPLTIGSTNERVRSNSESLLQANRDRPDRSSTDRSRRMGIVSRKAAELGTVDETNKSNRYSLHNRGLSHGSAMQGNGTGSNGNTISPASPADSAGQRATYVRRLSSLPERKRESTSPDPIIEGAKGVLYALFQVHPLIETLIGLVRNPGEKKSTLERVFYNAKTHVEELDQDVQRYDSYSEEDEEASPRSNENVKRACLTCVGAYIHVCAQLSQNVEILLINGDPRYIRTLLLQLYGSVAEVRNAGASLFPPGQSRSGRHPGSNHEAGYPIRDKSVTPTRERPGTNFRSRSATVIQHSNNLRVAIDAPPPFVSGNGRSATMTSATPRSGESFGSTGTSGRLVGDFTEEDKIFEKIFLRLQQTSEMALKTLPNVNAHFLGSMQKSAISNNADHGKQYWQVLIHKCTHALHIADALKSRLSQIKLKDPDIREQKGFWEICWAMVDSYLDLVTKVREVKGVISFIPTEIIVLLRPLQKAIKETGSMITASPWGFLANRQANGGSNGSYTTQSPASQVPLPMTPQSAALGPAVQATVPSTPQSVSFGAMFNGNVYERADTYLSNGSRTGTMSSQLGVNDGPTIMLSPSHYMNNRFNSNGKVAF